MTSPMEDNLLSTSELYDLIERTFDALNSVAIIICAFIILRWMDNDDDPDGYT